MRIAFVTAFPPERDGIADYSNCLITSLCEVSNDDFYVFSRSLGNKSEIKVINSQIRLFRIWRIKSLKDALKSIVALSKILTAIKADVIHIQHRFTRDYGGTAGEPFLVLMLVAKKLAKSKIVISLHDFWLPKEAEKRVYEITKSRWAAKLYRWYYALYFRIFLAIPDLIISVVNLNNSPITKIIKTFTRREVVEVLHVFPKNDFSIEKTKEKISKKYAKEKFVVSNSFTLVLFGFIRKSKGYHYVIKAVDRLVKSNPRAKGKIRLLICGMPPPSEEYYLRYLNKLITKLGLENVVLITPKYLDTKEIGLLFRAADIAVAPYTNRVGPSGVLSFSLAYEVPTIVTIDNKYFTQHSNLPVFTVRLNVDQIASAIWKLMTDPLEYDRQVKLIKAYKSINTNREIALLHYSLYRKLVMNK